MLGVLLLNFYIASSTSNFILFLEVQRSRAFLDEPLYKWFCNKNNNKIRQAFTTKKIAHLISFLCFFKTKKYVVEFPVKTKVNLLKIFTRFFQIPS